MNGHRALVAHPSPSAALPLLSRVHLGVGGRIELISARPALFVVGDGLVQCTVGLSTPDLGRGQVVRLAPGEMARVQAVGPATGWWLELEPEPDLVALTPTFGEAGALHRALAAWDRAVDPAALDLDLLEAARAEACGLHRAPSAHTALGRVRRLALARCEDRLSLEEMTRASGLSRFTLIRKFRQRVGTTPCAYHGALRLSRARSHLVSGRSPVEVAHELGYSDQSHFTRRFVRAYGVTPGRYAAQVAPGAGPRRGPRPVSAETLPTP